MRWLSIEGSETASLPISMFLLSHLQVLTREDLFLESQQLQVSAYWFHTATKRYMANISSSEILVDRHKIVCIHLKIEINRLVVEVCG